MFGNVHKMIANTKMISDPFFKFFQNRKNKYQHIWRFKESLSTTVLRARHPLFATIFGKKFGIFCCGNKSSVYPLHLSSAKAIFSFYIKITGEGQLHVPLKTTERQENHNRSTQRTVVERDSLTRCHQTNEIILFWSFTVREYSEIFSWFHQCKEHANK